MPLYLSQHIGDVTKLVEAVCDNNATLDRMVPLLPDLTSFDLACAVPIGAE
jgi:hypothetical protein